MPARWLKPSRILRIEQFHDADAYRAHDVLGGGTSTPLQPRDFFVSRAILPLRDGIFVLQRSFARRLDADLGTEQGLGLFIPIAFHCNINGRDVDNSTIGLMRGRTPSKVIEQHPNSYLMLRFNSDMRHRGWLDTDAALEYVQMRDENIQRLRAAILDMFCLASTCGDPREFEALNRPIQETFIAALDDALVTDGALRARPGSYGRHRKLIDRLDEQVELLGSVPLYSDDLAQALGVSVRTLQTATRVIHGVSLHQHLRLKRLWSVRRLLLNGGTGLTVKAAALAHGFAHMGDFSHVYKSTFGEIPSETLALGRHR